MCQGTDRHNRRGGGNNREDGKMIRFGSYTIRNGRKRVLDSALLGMDQYNLDLGVLQYNKAINRVYTRGLAVNAFSWTTHWVGTSGGGGHILPERATLTVWGAPYARAEHCDISAGIRRATMVRRGVILGPKRFLEDWEICIGHQLAPLRGSADDDQIL